MEQCNKSMGAAVQFDWYIGDGWEMGVEKQLDLIRSQVS